MQATILLQRIIACITCTGNAGRHSDGGVLSNLDFGQALDNGLLSIPDDQPLPGEIIHDCVAP